MNNPSSNLILASQSQTRKALLKAAGVKLQAQSANIDERALEKGPVEKLAETLAIAKAKAMAPTYPQSFIIGADQTLDLDGQLFYKPEDIEGVRTQLLALRGKTHRLISAFALLRGGEVIETGQAEAFLTLRDFNDKDLDAVLALEGDSLCQSVGGYRLEGPSIRLFEKIDGDYFTILGLPLLPLIRSLQTHAPFALEP